MSDCVPYAIHVVTGRDYEEVIDLALPRGWDAVTGMNGIAGWCLLRDMGFNISQMSRPGGRVTLAQFLPTLDPKKTYIVSVTDHWFAVSKGQSFDKARTHLRTEVGSYFEVLPAKDKC